MSESVISLNSNIYDTKTQGVQSTPSCPRLYILSALASLRDHYCHHIWACDVCVCPVVERTLAFRLFIRPLFSTVQNHVFLAFDFVNTLGNS